jgi:hypothetical protein
MYMIIWSCIRAGRFQGKKDTYEWMRVRTIIKERANELSAETLTKLIVLSTTVKEYEETTKQKTGNDLWDSLES